MEEIYTLSTSQEEEADGLFEDSGKRYVQTWLEFNCQEGHHYAKYSTNRNGARTRKIENGIGHLGTLGHAWAVGDSGVRKRIASFVSRHYPNCKFREVFDKDLERFGLSNLAPESLPTGWGRWVLAGSKGSEGEVHDDLIDAAEREEVQGDPHPSSS